MRVRVSAPPVDGAANEELVRVLAKEFDVPRRAIEIVSGHSTRLKRVSIEGLAAAKLEVAVKAKR